MDLKSAENMDFNLALDWMKEEYAKAGGEAKFHLHDAIVFMLKYKKLLEEQTQIVRCKYCKKQGSYDCHITSLTGQTSSDDWFCADGEKKEEC